jgi:Protein of unknown function (DUF3313)
MLIHKLLQLALTVSSIAALAACSTITPTHSTLTAPGELITASDGSQRFLKAPVAIQSVIHIEEVSVNLTTDSGTTLSVTERAELANELREQLVAVLGKTYKISETSSTTALALQATITEVRTSNVVGNIISTLLLTFPVDKGAAAVEFELRTPSGERVAALSVAAQSKFLQSKGAYSRLGQAKIVLAEHAKSLSDLLQGHAIASTKSNP